MQKKPEFIERTLFLIRKLLENGIPNEETTLDEMIDKRNKLLQKFMK
jgi:hypothetical protein